MEMEEAIQRSLDLLRRSYRSVEGACGWYHYLDDPTPGVTATAVGLYVFQLAGQAFEHESEVLHYLTSQQTRDDAGVLGGWSIRTTDGYPLIESTAWVLRSLSRYGANPSVAVALEAGVNWLMGQQNEDGGWGSSKGQDSRVFLTALSVLSLEACRTGRDARTKGERWLMDARDENSPAWGAVPGASPTVLHTAIAMQALQKSVFFPQPLATEAMVWIDEHISDTDIIETLSVVEEYDVPYQRGGIRKSYQNSLPHFAGPVALVTRLNLTHNPLSLRVFRRVTVLLRAQRDDGSWELPRSPTRPSIWAIWPFVAALTAAQHKIFPGSKMRVDLLYEGCALLQSADQTLVFTRALLAKQTGLFWLRLHWLQLVAWALIVALITAIWVLWENGDLAAKDAVLALLFPAALTIIQLVIARRSGSSREK